MKCPLLYTGASIEVLDSRVRPCCHFDTQKNLNIATLDTVNSFGEAQLNDDLNTAKEQIVSENITACKHCWAIENNTSKASRRQWSKTFCNGTGGLEYLQVMLDTTCNLQCRSCGPKESSKWNANKSLLETLYNITNEDQYKVKQLDNKSHWQKLKTFLLNTDLSNLKLVEVVGGEPFYSKNINEFFTILESKVRLNACTLKLVTNTTIFPNKQIQDIFSKFKKVDISLSVDGYGKLNETIRPGVSWEQIDSVVRQWHDLSNKTKNITLVNGVTVSIYNVNKIQEVVDYFESLDIAVTFTYLFGPEHLCIENLPLHFRNKIRVKMKDKREQKQFYSIIKSNRIPNKFTSEKFFAFTEAIDKDCGFSFQEVNKEIYDIIKQIS